MEANMMLLCIGSDDECTNDVMNSTSKEKLDYVQRSILKQINLFVDAFIQFYSFEDVIKSEKDLKRELVFNLVTNLVLTSELYFLCYNLQTSEHESDIKKLRQLMNDKAFLENQLHMDLLNITPAFQFDVNFRNKFKRTSQDAMYSIQQPYENTIKELVKVSKCESPMRKLELIYNCCT